MIASIPKNLIIIKKTTYLKGWLQEKKRVNSYENTFKNANNDYKCSDILNSKL